MDGYLRVGGAGGWLGWWQLLRYLVAEFVLFGQFFLLKNNASLKFSLSMLEP